ncbi:hypothetical protein Q7W37_09975 [Streptococcus suis]|nr:hypothetical protein [Streptococcus suis]
MAEIITAVGVFLVVGWLLVKLHTHTEEQTEYKRRALIDKMYCDAFGDDDYGFRKKASPIGLAFYDVV